MYHARYFFFFFNDTATTEIYTLSLHDALPISMHELDLTRKYAETVMLFHPNHDIDLGTPDEVMTDADLEKVYGDRKSTRLNSSHANISYAVFCLKKKKTI